MELNKTFGYALATVLGLSIAVSGVAQNFPDVPDNHWAYEALETMKREGLLVGYPDGLYRGGRPATRYEMAVAIHATYMHLKGITDGLQSQIDELKNGPKDNRPDLTARVEELERQVNGMKGWGDSINDLKRMMSEFEKELAAMGVDIEAMKKDIASLDKRVKWLEDHRPAVEFGGELTLLMTHGKGTSGRYGLGKDGSIVGGTPDLGFLNRASGLLDGLSVFHSAVLTMKGTNETGPKWMAALEVGNLLNGYGALPGSQTAFGGSRNDEAGTNIVFRRLAVDFDQSMLGQAVNFKVGRIGYKISPYMYQQPDTNPYASTTYDDNGEWTMDGAVLGFNFGPAKLDVFLGRTDGRNSNQANDIANVRVGGGQSRAGLLGANGLISGLNNGGIAGGIAADTTLGAHLTVPITDKGSVDLAYLVHSQNTPALGQDNVHVYGGEVNFTAGVVKLNGGYAETKSYLGNNSVTGLNRNNAAWHLGAGYEADKWGIAGGYRDIGMNYGAAGDWGRLGAWWNPRDIKGAYANGHFDFTESTSLFAAAQWMQGRGKAGGLATSDHIDSYKVGLSHEISEGFSANVAAEWVEYRFTGAGARGTQRWYDLGFSYNLSDMAKVSLLWEVSDADARTSGLWAAPGNANGRYSSNLITTQFTIKF